MYDSSVRMIKLSSLDTSMTVCIAIGIIYTYNRVSILTHCAWHTNYSSIQSVFVG